MSTTKARLKQTLEIHLPMRVAAVLAEEATNQGSVVGTLAATVLTKWAAMVEAGGQTECWKPVPVDVETDAIIRAYTEELGESETFHLANALMIFFDRAAEAKRKTGNY